MQAANAILAIDSLDRYITAGGPTIFGAITASWVLGAPTSLTLLNGRAIVGATLSYTPGVNGWPGGVVTIVSVVGVLVTISTPVTANSGGPIRLGQEYIISSASQPISNVLIGNYDNAAPKFNDFLISSPAALIYGYIDRIVVTQIQLQYNIPTVCEGKNDTLVIEWNAGADNEEITIPFGFYTPDELAAAIEAVITNNVTLAPLGITVTYDVKDGFFFSSANNIDFSFPSPSYLFSVTPAYTPAEVNKILKTYKLIGMTVDNSETTNRPNQRSFQYPSFLYTPYIDFYSDVLTNYQTIKDNNTSIAKPKGLVARILLSGAGNLQLTTDTTALGSAPFVMTADLNNPKVIKWSPDVAVPSIDFQLRDCYGELIPGYTEKFPTEFQMTLLCIEGQR